MDYIADILAQPPALGRPTLIILQGVPGSGKSTLANLLMEWRWNINKCAAVCSTDDYFITDVNETVDPTWPPLVATKKVYKFDPKKLGEYHQKNQERVANYLANGWDVIVDNTNIQKWECRPYVTSGLTHKAAIYFLRVMGNHKSVHGVPIEKIKEMKSRMEDLDIDSVMASKTPWER